MKILLSSSMKHKEKIKEAMRRLESAGVTALFPNIDHIVIDVETLEEKRKLAEDHFIDMKKADAVYFILPEGYMGTSCKLELGYALALGKKIVFSEKTNDVALDCYADAIVPFEDIETLASHGD